VSVDPWQPPAWHVTVPGPLQPPTVANPAGGWQDEARDFALTTVFVVLLGPVVGLIWSSVGPKLALVPALRGSASAYRAEVGAVLHFLLRSGAAGLLCAAVAIALRRDGPGVLLGLVVGGIGAAIVADRVGFLLNKDSTLDTLRHLGVSLALLDKYGIDPFFKVRALGVMLAWPLAAVVLYAVALAVRPNPR
jgi:hypothetical protein